MQEQDKLHYKVLFPSVNPHYNELTADSDELIDKDQEKLIKNIVTKSSESFENQLSLNKVLKTVINKLEPVLTNQALWRFFAELEKNQNLL